MSSALAERYVKHLDFYLLLPQRPLISLIMPQIVDKNPTNDPKSKPVKSSSLFKPNQSLYSSQPFGIIQGIQAMEVTGKDNINFRVRSDVDTYTLKAPLMSPVKINKDFFLVNLRAILPNNADYITIQPKVGDDINAYKANALLYLQDVVRLFSAYASIGWDHSSYTSDTSTKHAAYVSALIESGLMTYLVGELFLSDGSLLANMGSSLSKLFQIRPINVVDPSKQLDFDQVMELFFDYIKTNVKSFEIDLVTPSAPTTAVTYYVDCTVEPDCVSGHNISLRRLMEMLHEGWFLASWAVLTGPCVDATISDDVADAPFFGYEETNGQGAPAGTYARYSFVSNVPNSVPMSYGFNLTNEINAVLAEETLKPINVSPLVAYQIACATFYTNDNVDFIYSSALYHDNMRMLNYGLGYRPDQIAAQSRPSSFVFTLNGIAHEYDSVSAVAINRAMADLYSAIGTQYGHIVSLMYLQNIFCVQRSLKYQDYLVGAKVRPLAVGDVNVSVNNNVVNVVDVTKRIQMQRFLNQVNRTGRTLKEYARGIFGAVPASDQHDPIMLCHMDEFIGAEETSNTGADQLTKDNSVTSKLRSDTSRFLFEVNCTEPGYIIGVCYFDVPRPYLNSTDRSFLHVDRFDMFNPFMQNIGDQPVYGQEILPYQLPTFGYQLRYNEYRQRIDRAAGGFRHFLPGYAFVLDLNNLADPAVSGPSDPVRINPNFIRSRTEDRDCDDHNPS